MDFNVSDIKDNEVIVFSCPKCNQSVREKARKFFAKIPSLMLCPKMICKDCNETLCVSVVEESLTGVNA